MNIRIFSPQTMNTNKIISDTLKNNTKSITKNLTKPQKDAVKEITRGLFTAGKPILRQLAQNEEASAKSQSQKYGHHLENISIQDQTNNLALKKALPLIEEDTTIAYDLSDINKESARKMEKLSEIFDGSERKKANGYFIHGVGILNYPIRLKIHDSNKDTLPQIRKEIIDEITSKTDKKGIWALDRGNDSKDLFKYLNQKELKFIVRLKNTRDILIKETREIVKLKDLPVGRYKIYVKKRQGNKFDLKNEYLLIIHDNLKDKEPIRLICSTKLEDKTNTELVDIYLERWGVENIFKRIKSQFELEKIRVMKFKRLCSLVALIQFVTIVATYLYKRIKQVKDFLSSAILLTYNKFMKTKSLTYNLHSFISFMKSQLPTCRVYDKKPSDELIPSLFDFLPQKLKMF